MSGWTKLFSSIVTSSIWSEDNATRIVWVTMLALADAEGIVEGSIPGFARLANVTTDEMRVAVTKLSSPDPDSSTPDFEGRRIEPIGGGWRILNYLTYRDRGQAKDGSKAPAMRAYRARQRALRDTVTEAAPEGNALPDAVTGDPEERGERKEASVPEGKIGESSPSAPPPAGPRAEDLQSLWNEVTSPPLPRCRELDPTRRRHSEARLRDRGLDGMREVFARINASPFCRGENDRGWCANFDWALKPGSIAKILDGNYAGSPAIRRGDRTAGNVAALQRFAARGPVSMGEVER